MKNITRQEEMVLLAVYKLKAESSLVSIRRYLNKHTQNRWRMSSVYILLDRLTKSGCLTFTVGDSTPVRGGRAKKYYSLTEFALESLARVQEVNNILWEGLPNLKETLKNEK
jgi:DNA-binding PadR family transcriptional regulator